MSRERRRSEFALFSSINRTSLFRSWRSFSVGVLPFGSDEDTRTRRPSGTSNKPVCWCLLPATALAIIRWIRGVCGGHSSSRAALITILILPPMKQLFQIGPQYLGQGRVRFAWQPNGNVFAAVGDGMRNVFLFDRTGSEVVDEIPLKLMGAPVAFMEWDHEGEMLAILQQGDAGVLLYQVEGLCSRCRSCFQSGGECFLRTGGVICRGVSRPVYGSSSSCIRT